MLEINKASERAIRKTLVKRAVQGFCMGIGAPLGWMLIQSFRGIDLIGDIQANMVLYVYMLVATMVVFAAFGVYVGRQEGAAQQSAVRDMLTGLYNLRFFRDQLDRMIADAERTGKPLSLIFLDLDRFKRVNDTYGHAAGDIVLVSVAHDVSSALRKNEFFARVGGEEFAILLPHTNIEEAEELAERLRERVSKLAITITRETSISLTASLGVAGWRHRERAGDLVDRADKAMYAAKQAGRNTVNVDGLTKRD